MIRRFGTKEVPVLVYSLPSYEEGVYQYGMASGYTFASTFSDAQQAYDDNLMIREEQKRLAEERMLSKGESDDRAMSKIMRVSIAASCTNMLAEGAGGDINSNEEIAQFVKQKMSVNDVMVRYFKVARHLGHFVHSPRQVYDSCINDHMDSIVEFVVKGATKQEDRCYLQTANSVE